MSGSVEKKSRCDFSELAKLRVGCVQYLNAKPLIDAFCKSGGEVVFDHPSRLADSLADGALDVALVPIFEALRHADFPVVDAVSISSRGAVFSVALAYRGCLNEVKSVLLDPASRTSNHLLQVLFAEFREISPKYRISEKAETENDAQLLIGNQAIRFRQKHGDDFHFLDLGEEWMRRTSLPFVFAVWQMRPEVARARAVADELRALKEKGVARVREIAREQNDFAPEFAEHYLTENIRFDLGDEEKAGIEKFRELLHRHHLLSGDKSKNHALRFV